MGGYALYPNSVLQLPSFPPSSKPRFGSPVFSLKEIANRPFISSIRADGNRDGPEKNPSSGSASKAESFVGIPQSSDNRSSLSSNKEEILALFKRIQSSISKGEAVNSKKRISKAAEDKPSLSPSAESILEVLHQSRTPAKGRTISKKRDTYVAPEKDLLKEEEREEDLSTAGLKSTRPPSRFTRKSPIPSLSTPKEVIQSENQTLPATPALSIPRDEIELENNEDDGQESIKFGEMKLHQLKEVAKSKGIKGYSKLKKSELVDLLIRSLNDVSP